MAKTKKFDIRMDPAKVEEIDRIAAENSVDRSKLLRLIIDHFLREIKNGNFDLIVSLSEPV